MSNVNLDKTFIETKEKLIAICQDSGILVNMDPDLIMDDDMIEHGLIDSVGIVCLQDQIEAYFDVYIELEQFIGECHTLNKLIQYLSLNRSTTVRT